MGTHAIEAFGNIPGLIRYETACRAVAAALDVDEAKDFRDKSEAMRAYAKQAKNRVLEVQATELRFRAERRIGELMVEQLPELKRRVPTRELPTSLVRVAAVFDRDLKSILPELGRANLCDNQKSIVQMGMEFRSAEEAVKSAAQSLRELGVF